MTGLTTVHWVLRPVSPPIPFRHCGTCGTTRPFHCSGKTRLNANGRRLDAWLIYACATCARTWNRPLFERVAVSALAPTDLDALHHSTPDWVARRAHDLPGLRQYCDRVEVSADVLVTKPPVPDTPVRGPVRLIIEVPFPTGCRLDRLLSRNLPLPRARLTDLVRRGHIQVDGAARTLRKPVVTELALNFSPACVFSEDRAALARAFFASGHG